MATKPKPKDQPPQNGWEEVVESWDEIFTFDKPRQSLAGVLRAKVTDVGPNASTVYIIESDGVKYGVWGSAILDQRMQSVNPKDEVKLEYLGLATAPKSKREYHDFKVYTRGKRHAPVSPQTDMPF